jgi:bifunctional non-homologous end joining protein LigD
MPLEIYRRKRDFAKTPEPTGGSHRDGAGPRFVVQKHDATRLHYDFRLELDGVLKSWAVPKGPNADPKGKSLAVEVEDHPLDYADFEGTIPQGQYGGGTVMVWDRGTWTPEGDARRGLKQGKLTFTLDGEKLHGRWTLVRMAGRGGDKKDSGKKNWLLIKRSQDEPAAEKPSLRKGASRDRSILTGRTMDEIAEAKDRIWNSKQKKSPQAAAGRFAWRRTKRAGKPKIDKMSGTRAARLPATLEPQLATLVAAVPAGNDWLHEVKYDGYRILARIDGQQIRLLTRRGNDWSERFPAALQALANLNVDKAILDGEMVALDEHGATDFQRLQNWMQRGNDESLVYYVFDLPYFEGRDLTRTPLVERKAVLAKLLSAGGNDDDSLIRYSDHQRGQGEQVADYACQAGLEGVVSKRANSPYTSGRSEAWVKYKCLQRQEFVIGGYTQPSGQRKGFGSLLLGYYQGGKLRYAGHVGTGFTQQSLAELTKRLKLLISERPAFENPLRSTPRQRATWVRPELVAEVEFSEWTEDGVLRHPSFKGLRDDKPAAQIDQESAKPSAEVKKARKTLRRRPATDSGEKSTAEVAGIALSHPGRVYYPELELTKLGLARFYESIADWVLPHLVNRPLTMLRCPGGRTGQCFFQKHLDEKLPESLRTVSIREKSATRNYVLIDDLAGLISLVQRGVLEIHPWGSTADDLEHPDRLVIDLDPGEGVPWKAVVAAAREVREYLEAVELKCFVRTTGGKGLHVVVPLAAGASWDEHKEFAAALAQTLVARAPEKYLATMSKAQRQGKVFIDYLRNQRGATAVASYCTRAREQATVATPLTWTEVSPRLRPERFNVQTLPKRLATRSDPWPGFFELRQRLTPQILKAAREVLADVSKQ